MKTKDILPGNEYVVDTDALARHFSLKGYGLVRAYGEALGRDRKESIYSREMTTTVIDVGVERMYSERKDGVLVSFPEKVAEYLAHARPRHMDDKGNFAIPARCIEEPKTAADMRAAEAERVKQERQDERRAQLASLAGNIAPEQIGSLIVDSQENAKQATKDLQRYLRELQKSIADDLKRLEEGTTKVEDWEEKIPGYYRGDLAPMVDDDGVLLYPIIDPGIGTSHLEHDSRRAIEALNNYNTSIAQFNRWQRIRKGGEES